LQPKDFLLGPSGLVQQLQALESIFKVQQQWHFYSASILVVYEGRANTAQGARLSVKLVDFAHAFQTAGALADASCAQCNAGPKGLAPSGLDLNFLMGLQSLIGQLEKLLT
jgi:hypothetical protein